jgi:hypothetical protein
MGNTNTAIVRVAAEFRINIVSPETAMITQP